jgi:group II intron reverse transcriptase/maturase
MSRDPKQTGVVGETATGFGGEAKGGGPAGSGGADGECHGTAEAGETKVLNDELMERVLAPENLQAAYLAVKANKGAAGIDGIGTGELGDHLRKHWPGIRAKLEEGKYKPAPVRAAEIPKSGGGRRRLGIPTTLDRLIQQALHQVLDGIFDPDFSEHSYGFRRGRGARDAVKAARRLVVEEGRRWVVDIDIKAFFDHIDHDILMRMVALKAKDKRVLKLIGKYLRCGVLENGKVKRAAKGTPQGGPLSPLLGNIYLDALDRELESRGVAFCRYADDVTIYAKSPRSAQRILESIVEWIAKNLKLEVNRTKSGIRPPDQGSFLGFRIEEGGRIAMSRKSIEAFKAKVREHWGNPRSRPGKEVRDDWGEYVRGWMGYYRLSERSWDWEDLEGWLRRHMRKWFWLRWHNWKGRRKAFERLGVRACHLRMAHSGRGAWRMAKMLGVILTNRWLRENGFKMPSEFVKPEGTPS